MRMDIVHSAIMGHKTVWEERLYLLKLVAIPLMVKIICSFAIYTNAIDSVSLRHVLIMLPSYFFEGWMTAQFLRTMLTGERWPMRISGDQPTKQEMGFILWRARGILAAIITFVLIMMLQGGSAVMLNDLKQGMAVDPAQAETGANIFVLLLAITFLVFTLWAFRLTWLYIPMVILTPTISFLKDIKGMMTSIYMIGIWIMSVIPTIFITFLLSGFLMGAGSDTSITNGSFLGFLTILIHIIGQFIAQIIAVTAMAHALKPVLIKYGAKPIFNEPDKPY